MFSRELVKLERSNGEHCNRHLGRMFCDFRITMKMFAAILWKHVKNTVKHVSSLYRTLTFYYKESLVKNHEWNRGVEKS